MMMKTMILSIPNLRHCRSYSRHDRTVLLDDLLLHCLCGPQAVVEAKEQQQFEASCGAIPCCRCVMITLDLLNKRSTTLVVLNMCLLVDRVSSCRGICGFEM